MFYRSDRLRVSLTSGSKSELVPIFEVVRTSFSDAKPISDRSNLNISFEQTLKIVPQEHVAGHVFYHS